MKKTVIALVLCLALLCSLVLPAAAEDCYVALQCTFGYEEVGGDLFLGEAYIIPVEQDNKMITIGVCTDKGYITLTGVNAAGEPEQTVWENVDSLKALYVVYAVCNIWDKIASFAEEGYQPLLALFSEAEPEKVIYVYDSESAARITGYFSSIMSGK